MSFPAGWVADRALRARIARQGQRDTAGLRPNPRVLNPSIEILLQICIQTTFQGIPMTPTPITTTRTPMLASPNPKPQKMQAQPFHFPSPPLPSHYIMLLKTSRRVIEYLVIIQYNIYLMVFRIRDKSLFWTKSGWKNTWEPKILNMPKPINSANTQYVTCRFDHHSFLRIVQAYRNISRTCKQYLYGDTNAEQFLILELRNQFKLPFYCETPVELIKDGAERRFADQIDRDYELISHNYHPVQLFTYELQNKYIRKQNEAFEAQEKGEKTFDQVFCEEVQKQVKDQEKKLGPGEKVSLDKITDIFLKVSRSARGFTNQQGGTRNEQGQFNDFLEKRRPFLNPNPTGHSH